MNKLVDRINNNSEASLYLSLVNEFIVKENIDDILSHIYTCYKELCKNVDISLLTERKLGKYLGLKVFFEHNLKDENIFAGHEIMSKNCEKQMYKTLKMLCELPNETIELINYDRQKTWVNQDISELALVYQILESDPQIFLDEVGMYQNRRDFSNELKFTLKSFHTMRQMLLDKRYQEALKVEDILFIPYYYVDNTFIKMYEKLPDEYKTLFQRLYEYQLQQDLETDKIHVDVFISKNNLLMCMVTKKKEKIKK